MARESRTYFFDPSDFVKAAAGFLPGAILSLGWSAHGICDDTFDAAKARKAYEDWYASGDPGTFEWDLDEEGGTGDEGGRRRRRRTLSEDDAPEAEDGSDDAAASGDDAAAAGDSASNALPQMRCDEQLSVAAENAPTGAGSPDSAASTAPSTVLTTKCRYDLNAAALAREAASPATDAGYGEATARDMYWVLRDAGWAGDVIFDARACALARGRRPGRRRRDAPSVQKIAPAEARVRARRPRDRGREDPRVAERKPRRRAGREHDVRVRGAQG